MLFPFVAYSLAPFLFALGVAPVGGYGPCFVAVAGVQALAVPAMLRVIRTAGRR